MRAASDGAAMKDEESDGSEYDLDSAGNRIVKEKYRSCAIQKQKYDYVTNVSKPLLEQLCITQAQAGEQSGRSSTSRSS